MKHLVWGKSLAALQKSPGWKKKQKPPWCSFCTAKEVSARKNPCKTTTLLSGVKSFLKFPRQALISGTGEVPREGMRQVTGPNDGPRNGDWEISRFKRSYISYFVQSWRIKDISSSFLDVIIWIIKTTKTTEWISFKWPVFIGTEGSGSFLQVNPL